MLLSQICLRNDIECEHLVKYTKSRDQILKETMDKYKVTRDETKGLFLALLYAGKFEHWGKKMKTKDSKPTKFIKNFADEFESITNEIVEQNPKLAKIIKDKMKLENEIIAKHNLENKNKPDFQKKYENVNFNGSFLSSYLQEYERRVLETIFNYLQKKGHIVDNECVLCFDGIMILKENYDEKILKELSEEVKLKLGFDLVFTQKVMDKDMLKELESIEEDVQIEIVENDKEASEKLYKLYPHFVCCYDMLYVFDKDEGLWTTSLTSIYKVITQHSNYLHIVSGKNDDTKKSYGNTLNLMKILPDLIKILCKNDKWFTESENSSLGKLLFNNGYYDLKETKFYQKDEKTGFQFMAESKIVFFGKIHHDFEEPTKDNLTYIEYVKKTLFHTPLEEDVGDFLLLNLSRGLARDKMKKLLFGLGETNSGKSLIYKSHYNGMRRLCGNICKWKFDCEKEFITR